MDIDAITGNIRQSCDELGQVDLAGVKLEEACRTLLDVSEHTFDRHVAVQPSAIAFYGVMRKELHRRLDAFKRSTDRWEKKMYAQAKAAVLSGTSQTYKPTVADVEARFIVDNEKEIEKHEKQLEKLQDDCDTLDSWYEGWRQKSFTIREWAGITEDERYNSESSMTPKTSGGGNGEARGGAKELNQKRIDKVRQMMRQKKADKLAAQG